MFYVKYPEIYEVVSTTDVVDSFPNVTDDPSEVISVTYRDKRGNVFTDTEVAPTMLCESMTEAESFLAWIAQNHQANEAELERRRQYWAGE